MPAPRKPIDSARLVADAANKSSKAAAAAAQGVSVSTLRRRLADQGTNWSGKQEAMNGKQPPQPPKGKP